MPENNRNYTQILNASVFELENFQGWLKEAEQISAQNHLTLKRSFIADTPSTAEEVFNEFFLSERVSRADISPSLNQPSPPEITSEVHASQKCGDLRKFPEVVSIENVLGWLRLEFQQGNNPIREGPKPLDPIEKGNCPLCPHKNVDLPWQVQFVNDSRIDACCLNCGGKINDLVQEFRLKSEGDI